MKYLSETKALISLDRIKRALRQAVASYEQRAKSCQTCETPGACCLDAHFVNVHVSRLEAVAIHRALGRLSATHRERVEMRIDEVISDHDLTNGNGGSDQKYACPLFEAGIGCLVHDHGKPSACIVHACYEDSNHLPPDDLQQQAEHSIDTLNARTYGRDRRWLPIPLALRSRCR